MRTADMTWADEDRLMQDFFARVSYPPMSGEIDPSPDDAPDERL